MAKKPGKPVFLRELHLRYRTVKAKGNVSGTVVKGPETVVQLFQDLQDESKEKLIIINLNNANKILCYEVVAIGGVNLCHSRPIDIFTSAFLTRAVSAIVVHNHPSGDPKPSAEDRRFTKELVKVAGLIKLKLLDHIIIGSEGYYSFAQEGKIRKAF